MRPLRVSCCSAAVKPTDFRLILMSLKTAVEYFSDAKKINVSFRLFDAVVSPFPSVSLPACICVYMSELRRLSATFILSSLKQVGRRCFDETDTDM